MKRLRKKQIGRTACTILQQLALTTPLNVVESWGMIKKGENQIEIKVSGTEKTMAFSVADTM